MTEGVQRCVAACPRRESSGSPEVGAIIETPGLRTAGLMARREGNRRVKHTWKLVWQTPWLRDGATEADGWAAGAA